MKKLLVSGADDDFREFLRSVRRIAAAKADELERLVTQEDKIDLYARSSLSRITRAVWFYGAEQPESRPFARAVLKRALEVDFAERVRYGAVGPAGRLLKAAVEVDKGLAKRAAMEIAKHVDLQGEFTSEDLSLALTNIAFDLDAQTILAGRVTKECDPESLLSKEPRERYVFILGQIGGHVLRHPELLPEAKRFFHVFSKLLDTELFVKLTDRQVGLTIWNYVVVGVSSTPWLRRMLPELSRRLETATVGDIFWILWNLLQSDTTFCREVASRNEGTLMRRIISEASALAAALVGLLGYLGLNAPAGRPSLDAAALADALAAQRNANVVLFALKGVQLADVRLFHTVCDLIRSRVSNVRKFIQDLIEQNPIGSSRHVLSQLAAELGLQ